MPIQTCRHCHQQAVITDGACTCCGGLQSSETPPARHAAQNTTVTSAAQNTTVARDKGMDKIVMFIVTGIGAIIGVIINGKPDSGIGGTLGAGNAAFAGGMVAAILYGILV